MHLLLLSKSRSLVGWRVLYRLFEGELLDLAVVCRGRAYGVKSVIECLTLFVSHSNYYNFEKGKNEITEKPEVQFFYSFGGECKNFFMFVQLYVVFYYYIFSNITVWPLIIAETLLIA